MESRPPTALRAASDHTGIVSKAARFAAKSEKQDRVLADFAVYLRVEKGLAPLTISSYEGDLKLWASWLGGRRKTLLTAQRDDLQSWLQNLLGHGMDARSVARKLSAVRGLYRYLLLDKRIAHDPTLEIDSPRQWKVLPKALSEEETGALIESCGSTAVSDAALRATSPEGPRSKRTRMAHALELRDRAMLEVLYAAAVRVSEVVNARVADTKLELGYMLVRGKGDKERLVPLGAPAQEALRGYLRDGRPLLIGKKLLARGKTAAELFLARGGHKLTRERIWMIVERAGRAAGRHASPHMLRHSAATHMVSHGADLRTVQTVLGHADISTTQVYTHVALDRLQKVYQAHHPRARKATAPLKPKEGLNGPPESHS
jgi:integrase/recombinase XerD